MLGIEPNGVELWRRNVRRSTVALIGANALAAIVVFVFITWVIPVPAVADPERTTLLNLAVFVGYVAVVFPVVWVWSIRQVRPIRAWMVDGREPTPVERDLTLRAPLHQLQILAAGLGWRRGPFLRGQRGDLRCTGR